MNDLHRLFEDATPEPPRGLSVNAIVAAARRRRRLRAGAAGLALALVLGGVGTAFAVSRGSGTQTLQPAETPAPTAPPSASPDPAASAELPVDIALFGPSDDGCGGSALTLVQRPADGPPTPERALRALFSTEPTPSEKAAGLFNAFPATAADLLISVRLVDGIAYVNLHDFRSLIPHASASCASLGFYSVLQKTLAPFGVGSLDPVGPLNSTVRIAIDGDPRPAADFFQIGCREPVLPGDPCDPSPFLPSATDAPAFTVQVALTGPGKDSCAETTMVSRPTDGPPTPERALNALFAARTTPAEKAAGLSSFPPGADDLLISVRIVDEIAYVNLHEFQAYAPGAGTTCGTALFLSKLQDTLAPFGAVDPVRVAIEGDPGLVENRFQFGCPDQGKPGDRCDPTPFLD